MKPAAFLTHATAIAAAAMATVTVAPATASHRDARPATYLLTGDAGGSKFEGIGADQRRGVFYVSEVTGGEIHRGVSGTAQTEEWLAGDGEDGRFTARGITVDKLGRVYVAGGPNGLGTGRPDLWVYSPDGTLLAALRVPGSDVFLNDVAIGPDGAAYFTNSNDPQVFRVAAGSAGWQAGLWSDASGTIERGAGFNLGGIVLTADHSAFVVAQGNAGRLWRFPTDGGAVTEVTTGDADLVNADGLVRRGSELTVVRNFSRKVATLRLTADGRVARELRQVASDPTRVLTTVKVLRGQFLYVDSKFDETVASAPYEIVTDPVAR
ncbi:MAG TPA: gluconolaconase [Nocardioides sp.]|uniref:SMP-30/gluconolactonase/LRE family protein n=1 Tax=Nocardioides sp. TaxID=35761 RepID=UPI002ED8EE9E